MTDQTLNVKITGDASSFDAATQEAAKSLDTLKAKTDTLDAETITITPELQVDRLNRDLANLKKVLARIEAQKANPDVGLDLTRLLADERKVETEIGKLESEKATIEADVDVNTTGLTELRGALTGAIASGGGIGGLQAGLAGLSGEAAGMAKLAGGIGAVAIAVGKTTSAAADLETLRLQLQAVFGDGQQALDMMQQFAAVTPFSLNEVAQAARSLGLAGVDLQQIPDWLTAIGDAASLTSTQDLQAITFIFTQMINKGQIMAEEIQQLAEQGVPAWQALADSQGKSVEQVQKMVTAGKLGADAVQGFVAEFATMFPTAMADQADTFNGKMSTLGDTMNQVSANIGEEFLPAAKQGADALIVIGNAAVWATQKMNDLSDVANDPTLFGEPNIDPSKGFLGRVGDAFKSGAQFVGNAIWDPLAPPPDMASNTDEAATAVDDAATAVYGLDTAIAGFDPSRLDFFDPFTAQIHDLNGEISSLDESISGLVSNFTVLKSGVADLPESLEAAATASKALREDLTGADGILSPSTKNDALAAADAWAKVAAAQVENGRSVESATSAYHKHFDEITKGNGELARFLEQSTTPIKPLLARILARVEDRRHAEADLERLTHARKVEVTPIVRAAKAGSLFAQHILGEGPTAPMTAPVDVKLDGVDESSRDLDTMTKPRDAPVKPHLDPSALSGVNQSLIELTRPRTVTITPMFLGGSSGQFGSSSSSPPPSNQDPNQRKQTTDLAPKSSSVKVFLDGAEIADRLELRARDLAASTGSLKRRP